MASVQKQRETLSGVGVCRVFYLIFSSFSLSCLLEMVSVMVWPLAESLWQTEAVQSSEGFKLPEDGDIITFTPVWKWSEGDVIDRDTGWCQDEATDTTLI